MTWEEFKKQELSNYDWNIPQRKPTNITCPNCGQYIYKRMDIICTSYPPQNKYECECGWVGFSSN